MQLATQKSVCAKDPSYFPNLPLSLFTNEKSLYFNMALHPKLFPNNEKAQSHKLIEN